jgi:hypothetical protein
MGKVLVLNQDYSALSVCTVPKAFLLVYMNKAEMLAEISTTLPSDCQRPIPYARRDPFTSLHTYSL